MHFKSKNSSQFAHDKTHRLDRLVKPHGLERNTEPHGLEGAMSA